MQKYNARPMLAVDRVATVPFTRGERFAAIHTIYTASNEGTELFTKRMRKNVSEALSGDQSPAIILTEGIDWGKLDKKESPFSAELTRDQIKWLIDLLADAIPGMAQLEADQALDLYDRLRFIIEEPADSQANQ